MWQRFQSWTAHSAVAGHGKRSITPDRLLSCRSGVQFQCYDHKIKSHVQDTAMAADLLLTFVNHSFRRRTDCDQFVACDGSDELTAISSSRATGQTSSAASAKIVPWVIEHTANGQRAEF